MGPSLAEGGARLAMAQRQAAEAELAAEQAKLDAQLAPLKSVNDVVLTMSQTIAAKQKLERSVKVSRDAAAINDGLGAAQTLEDKVKLGMGNYSGLEDPDANLNWKNSTLGSFTRALDNAQTTVDVDKITSSLPASLTADPDFDKVYTNARKQAERREKVALGAIEVGMPATGLGGTDIVNAEQAVAIEKAKQATTEKTRKEADVRMRDIGQSYEMVSRQIANAPLGAEIDPKLIALRDSLGSQLIQYSQSLINGGGMPAAGAGAPQPTGQGGDWTTDLIPQGVTVPTARTPGGGASTDVGTTPAPTPTTTSAPQATAVPPPATQTKTATELRTAAQKVDTLSKELTAMKESTGLADQPFGIRQINEAMSSENAAIRAKAEELRQAQLDVNPFAFSDTGNAKDIATALELVYPKIGGNDMNPKFDVGSPKDSKVMAAAMFLQKVRPEFLKMVASGPGVDRGQLSFKEIDDIVKNQPNATGKRTTR
jgi:hypothetical protein